MSPEEIRVELWFLELLQKRLKCTNDTLIRNAFAVRCGICVGTILKDCCILGYKEDDIKKTINRIYEKGNIRSMCNDRTQEKNIDLAERIPKFSYIVYRIITRCSEKRAKRPLPLLCSLYKKIHKQN